MEKETKTKVVAPTTTLDQKEEKGKTLAPPPFQLKADPLSSSQQPVQMARSKKKRKREDDTDDPKVKKRRNTYTSAQYGGKGQEQKRLSTKFKAKVNGQNFQNEHIIGFQSLANVKGSRGSNAHFNDIENFAPTYYEEYRHHRKNINTGNKTKTIDGSGFNATTFRMTQREMLKDGDLSGPMQINQLSYAHQGGFQTGKNGPSIKERQANNSFLNMVTNTNEVTFVGENGDQTLNMTQCDRYEVLVSRFAAKNSRYPNSLEAFYLGMASRRAEGYLDDESIFEPKSEEEEIKRLNGTDEKEDLEDDKN